jgi:hypothetical protein
MEQSEISVIWGVEIARKLLAGETLEKLEEKGYDITHFEDLSVANLDRMTSSNLAKMYLSAKMVGNTSLMERIDKSVKGDKTEFERSELNLEAQQKFDRMKRTEKKRRKIIIEERDHCDDTFCYWFYGILFSLIVAILLFV